MNCPHCLSLSVQRRGTRRGRRRYYCNDCRTFYSSDRIEDDPKYALSDRDIRALGKVERFLITSSQNNTPIDQRFWASLQRLREERGAKLLVPTVRYRNPTSPHDAQDSDDDVWWPREVEEYLVESEVPLHPLLWLMGDTRVQATAVHPLTGLESITAAASGIVPHAQIAMKTVPTPQSALPKIMHTTGSCSIKNYSRTKAGKMGWFHHSLGALLVEKEGGRFHMRVINGASDGSFYDLNRRYSPEGVEVAEHIPAIVTGDEHARFMDPDVLAATYMNEDSIVRTLKPKVIVRGDVFDAYSCTHWDAKDVLKAFVKWEADADNVEAELEDCREHLDSTTPLEWECTNVLTYGNHDDMLRRWLRDTKQPAPKNARVYHELMSRMLEESHMTPQGAVIANPLELWMRHRLTAPTRFLRVNDSFIVKGIELGMHGHRGANGARGSLSGFSKIGVKTMIGHPHSPGIEKGAYQVGTSTYLEADYAEGPSSWFQTHGIVLPNGKRQLINIIEGHWRA